MEMWHNPSCSKCAAATSALADAQIEVRLRPYLQDSPSVDELEDVLARLGMQPWEICRDGPQVTDWPRDAPRDAASRSRWIEALAEHPELIQRPILLLADGTAIIGRTPEALAEAITAEKRAQRK